MATRITPTPPASAPAGGGQSSQAERDLEILHPERDLVVGGRLITMREYGFTEGLKVLARAQPFLAALKAYAIEGSAVGAGFAKVEAVLIEQPELMLSLIAQAADVKVEFIEGLSDEEGYRLMQVWWLVNQGFFLRRVIQSLAAARADERRAGPGSTQPSSPPASDAPQPTSAA